MDIIKKRAAKELGMRFYYTGKQCQHGHDAMRYVSNSKCVDCASSYMSDYYQKNKDYFISKVRQWQYDNDDKLVKHRADYYNRNKKSILLKKSVSYAANSEYFTSYYKANREDQIARVRDYQKRNPGKVNAHTAQRRVNLVQRSFTKWDDVITLIYEDCPDGYHVDHIDPINAIDRSGLHVPWNLQYLPALDNHQKSNKTDFISENAIEINWTDYI
jgi:hypothetical protein